MIKSDIVKLDKIRKLNTSGIMHTFQSRYTSILNQETIALKDPTYVWKPVSVEANTGAGKTEMVSRYMNHFDDIQKGEKFTLMLSAPVSSNAALFRWVAHIVTNGILDKVGFGLVLDKTILTNTKINNDIKYKLLAYNTLNKVHFVDGIQDGMSMTETAKFISSNQYNVVIGLNMFMRKKILPMIHNNKQILSDITFQMIIDEAQGEMHSSSDLAFELNCEYDPILFPKKSASIWKVLQFLRISTMLMSGTLSKEQRQDYTPTQFKRIYNKDFDFTKSRNDQYFFKHYKLTEKETLEIMTRNAKLDRIICLATEMQAEMPYEFLWYHKRWDGPIHYRGPKSNDVMDKLNSTVNSVVYEEFKDDKGCWLVETAIRHHGKASIENGISTKNIIRSMVAGRIDWDPSSVLIWDGRCRALVSDIDEIEYLDNSKYTKHTEKGTLGEVLERYDGQIRLVLIKNLDKTAFDYPHLNGNIWLRPTMKVNEHTNPKQFFGRTVRLGENHLVHIFLSYTQVEYQEGRSYLSDGHRSVYNPKKYRENFLDNPIMGGNDSFAKMMYSIMYDNRTISSKHHYDKVEEKLSAIETEKMLNMNFISEFSNMSLKLSTDKDFQTKVIESIIMLSDYGEKKLENNLISSILSSRIESVIGTYGFNIVCTGGNGNHEDGFIWYKDENDMIHTLAYDIKVILEKRNGQKVMLKDKTRGDGQIDQSVVYPVFVFKEDENARIYFDKYFITEFDDDLIDTYAPSNSISLKNLATIAVDKIYNLNSLYSNLEEV